VGFFVRPEALDDYAKLVERNGINLSLTNVHLAGESRLENTEGLWIQHLVGAHTQTVDRMLTSLAQGFHQMGASADELSRTAAYYRSVDQVQAVNLDNVYPRTRTGRRSGTSGTLVWWWTIRSDGGRIHAGLAGCGGCSWCTGMCG
jgi:hypothetical protein